MATPDLALRRLSGLASHQVGAGPPLSPRPLGRLWLVLLPQALPFQSQTSVSELPDSRGHTAGLRKGFLALCPVAWGWGSTTRV